MEVRFRKLVAPLGVQLELTPLCSNRCSHCYNYWRNRAVSTSGTMSKTQFLKAIDILAEAKIFWVTITGGEPLFVRPLWRTVLEKLASYGIACDMNSNLVDVNQDDISLMRECGLRSILTSFHSYKENIHDEVTDNPGSFRKTLMNIETLAEKGVNVGANMVVNKRNFRDVYETCRLLVGVGVKSFNATRFLNPIREEDFSHAKLTTSEIGFVIKQLLAAESDLCIPTGSLTPYPFCFLAHDKKLFKFARRTCNAGITVASLEYTGFLRACPSSEKRYGNIFLDGLENCWQAMHPWREGAYIPSECNGCFYLLVCRGSCRVDGMKIGRMVQKDDLMSDPIREEVKDLIQKIDRDYSIKDYFVVCDKIKYRKEDFGYAVVGHKINSPAFVSDTVLKTLVKLKGPKQVQVGDFLNEWGANLMDVRILFSYLEDREIITRKKVERR